MDNETGDLLEQLKNVRNKDQLEEYLDSIDDIIPGSFAEYARALLREKGITSAELPKIAMMDRTYVHQILSGRKNPRKDKIVTIALASHWTFEETQRGLEIAGEDILYSKSTRDSILIYALNQKMNVRDTNCLLAGHGEKELE